MSAMTEAEALLRSGALYPRRVGLRPTGGELVFAGFKPGGFSIYRGDAPFYHFDLEGRWQRAFVGATHYLKGLDAEVDAIDRVREGAHMVLRRRRLTGEEVDRLDASIRADALKLAGAAEAGGLEVSAPPDSDRALPVGELVGFLRRVGRWDPGAWRDHRRRHAETYGPRPFLPPDCQHAVVLQATLGAPGASAFAPAASGASGARSEEAFERHAREVRELLGARLAQARHLFLAGPDVLRQPVDRVERYLEIASEVFPIASGPAPKRLSDRPIAEPFLEGFQAFLDDFSPPLPDASGWGRLRRRHLGRVGLGVASGSAEVRSLAGVGAPAWGDEDLRRLVSELKAAGLPLSLIVLLGAGGSKLREAHEDETIGLLGSLDLGREDLIYLIDAEQVGASGRPRPDGRGSLEAPERSAQQARFKEALSPSRSRSRPGARVVPYNPEKQPG